MWWLRPTIPVSRQLGQKDQSQDTWDVVSETGEQRNCKGLDPSKSQSKREVPGREAIYGQSRRGGLLASIRKLRNDVSSLMDHIGRRPHLLASFRTYAVFLLSVVKFLGCLQSRSWLSFQPLVGGGVWLSPYKDQHHHEENACFWSFCLSIRCCRLLLF